jgi:hypothetical protein
MKKPELITTNEVFFDYYFTKLIEEQKKTNKLLEQLLDKEGVQDVKRSISKT